jgi:hypothetical protein
MSKSQNLDAGNSILKYKGNWGESRIYNYDSLYIIDSNFTISYVKIRREFLGYEEKNIETSDTCFCDSIKNIFHSTIQLSDLKHDDNLKAKVLKSFELSVIYNSRIDRTLDVFKFETKCINRKPLIEFIFFSKDAGLIIYHYINYDDIFEITKRYW